LAGFHPIAAATIVALALSAQAKPPASDMDDVRRSYIELRRDTLLAQPSPILPADSQVAIYVSVDPRATATLNGLSIEVDGHVVSQPHYSPAQFAALRRGASDRVYVGAVPDMSNTLVATFSGVRGDGNPFVRVANLDLPQSAQPRYVELKLSHTQTKDLPDVEARVALPNMTAAVDPLCDWLLGCLVPASVATPADLLYRSVLYPVYQDDDERALVQAMAISARTTDYQPGAAQRLQLAQAASAFAIGARGIALDASRTLEGVSPGPQERIRLALLRARDSYRRQDWAGLDTELATIAHARNEQPATPAMPATIDTEIAFMRAELATARGDFDRAQYIITTELPPQDSLRAYAMFNLGVVLRTSGIPTRSERVFTQLVSMPVYAADALDVKERARVALSVVNLQRTQSASAEAVLRDAPAQGRYHDQFMVSYATRVMEHGDYELAARIWLTLANEAPWSTAGKTAQVAYPMCLEHIAAPTVVLAQYRDAQAKFEKRLADLDALTRNTDDPAWIAALLASLEEPPGAGLPHDPTIAQWRNQLGHDDWLYWFNADSTQKQFHELRELERISGWLAADVPKAFDSRARALAANASRLANDRRVQLARAVSEIAHNEFAMAQQQLRLIKVGIARTTDRVAEQRPPQAKP
jgi:hypothetical protein